MKTADLTPAALISELVAETIRRNAGAVGVLVRDLPAPDPTQLIRRLASLRKEKGIDLRVAYLLPGGEEAAEEIGADAGFFSHEVEQAERWRNERDLEALIVVVAHGDEAKLSSLEEFTAITSRDLKRVLVDRALGEEAGRNEVQMRWWMKLGEDDGFGLGQLVDYYLALSGKQDDAFLEASSREVFRLGLLPDPGLFNEPRAVNERVKKNRELIGRFQTLTPKDRKNITQRVQSEEDPEEKQRLRQALDQLRRTRWEGEGMRAIDFGAAERLVKTRARKRARQNGTDDPPRPPREKVADVAAEALIDKGRAEDLETIVVGLREHLNNLEEPSLRPESVKTDLPNAGEAVASARLDIINLMSKMLDDGVYGGLVEIEDEDLEDVLRRFDDQRHTVERWEREHVAGFLDHLSVDDAGTELAAKLEAYDEARGAVLPLMRSLAAEPLAVAANPGTRTKLLALIEAYEVMNQTALDNHERLFDEFGPDVHEAFGYLLLLEMVVIRAKGQTYAIPAPTHPLSLWHYARYCQVVEEQRERLEERDKDLVIQAAQNLPNFMTSVFVPPKAFDRGVTLPYMGRLGPLPYFGEKVEVNASNDGVKEVRRLIEAHLALEPHSRLGLRLALVDPPDAGVYLSLLADLADREQDPLVGAHLTVYRHPRQKPGIELQLDEEEEERVARVFRSLTPDRRFTFEVRELPEQEIGPPERNLHHMAVIFDRGGSRLNRARPTAHPIQPLALPRRLRYSNAHEVVELEPESGGPFDSYDRVGKHLGGNGGGSSYLSVHQERELRGELEKIASRVPWTVVADRHVDRDLALGNLRVSTGRDGERDVAAFSKSAASFRRPLREVVRNYNAFVSEDELDGLLDQLSNLLDAGLLNLLPDVSGKTNHNRVKGLLGTLIAARWFRQSSSGDRLLVSLDGADARRWLHLSDEPLRADLVAFEWTDEHCTVSVIEVKAVQDSGREYTVTDGVVEGPAIRQMLATRRLLESVFASEREDELITTPARREVLREHLYRELTKGTYPPQERKLWAKRLQELLSGSVTVDLRCHLVDVRLGVDASTLDSPRNTVAREGETLVPVQITQLNQRPVAELVQVQPADQDGPDAVGGERADEPAPTKPPSQPPEQGPPPKDVRGPDVAEKIDSSDSDVLSHPERARAFLGTSPGTYGKPREVWFDPHVPENPLPNPHISITGETGSGKTQATKAIIKELKRCGAPALILDFKDDYSEPLYAETEGLQVYDPSYESLPFNPLAPPVDLRTGQVNPTLHIYGLGEIVKRIYRLGDQQTHRLREAFKRAYEAASVSTRPFEPVPEQTYPPFEAVRTQLEAVKGNEALLGRLSPIFDLGLFSSKTEADFASIVASSTVVRLGQLPGDETKNSVAEFFLMALYNNLIRQPQIRSLNRLLVLDEAWRLVESPFLEPLIREGRAFGLGVLVATQFPSDLPGQVSGSTATKLFFSQTQLDQIREIQRTVVGKTSGPDADHLAGVLKGLEPLTCVLHNKQHLPFGRIRITPYFER